MLVVDVICLLPSSGAGQASCKLSPVPRLQDSKGRQTFVTAATMAKVVRITAAVYTEHLPGHLRAEMLTPLVAILGR
jgi:hypothetical protein